jgi:hypothetical protein
MRCNLEMQSRDAISRCNLEMQSHPSAIPRTVGKRVYLPGKVTGVSILTHVSILTIVYELSKVTKESTFESMCPLIPLESPKRMTRKTP